MLVNGTPFKAFGLTIHKVTRKLHLHEQYGIPLPDLLNPYRCGFVEGPSFTRLLDGLEGTRFNTIHVYLRLTDEGYRLPFPEECVPELEPRGFKLAISLPFHWLLFPGLDVIEEAVKRYRDLDALLMWVVGAEVFDYRFRVPFDLIDKVSALVGSLSDVPKTYGNMPFNNAPGSRFRLLGVETVDCTDAIGFFDFTPLQLLSMSEFILSSWWMVQGSFRPLVRKLISCWFSMYNAFMSLIPRSDGEYQTIDSNLGYAHMLKRQIRYAAAQGKPLVVAQAGLSDNVDFMRRQLAIVDSLPLAGYFYWNSGNLDPDYDGEIENVELLKVFCA